MTVQSSDLVNARGYDDTAVLVIGGTVRRRDGALVLDAHSTGYSPYFGLTEARDGTARGLDAWVDQQASVRGCYTSGDVRRPEVRGAAGMLRVERLEMPLNAKPDTPAPP